MAASMSRPADMIWRIIGALYVVFLLTPLLLVVLFSFTNRGIAAFPIEHFSLQWWRAMIDDPEFFPALKNSLTIGGTVGLISAVVGTMAAMGLARIEPGRAQTLTAVLCLPLMLPPLLLAVSLLSFYTRAVGIPLTLATVIMSHLLFTLPFVVLVVYARLRNFDYRVVESARDLGASPLHAFLTVTLPIIRPTVVGAALIAVSLSVDDFIITNFTIGGGVTLPTFVWGMIRTSLTPAANAVGTLILVLTVGTTLIALRLTRYRG
jgi:spermidine/putrescine transport system permease protein